MIGQGDVWWADLAEPTGSEAGFRRPVVVVQSDNFNRSALLTVVAVPAVIFFNIFQSKTVAIEDNVGALGNAVVALMKRDAGRDRDAPDLAASAPGGPVAGRDRRPAYPEVEA